MKAWSDSLGGITYPLLSDFWPHGDVAKLYGILRSEGHSERAIFLIDARGFIRYIDVHDIDSQPVNAVLFAEIAKLEPELAQKLRDETPPPDPLPHGGIVMYCTPWCPDCKRARVWLKEHQLPYREINIHTNTLGAEAVKQWTGGNLTTPTFDIDGKIVIDFDENQLNSILKMRS